MFQSIADRFKSDSPSPPVASHSSHAIHSSKPAPPQDTRFNSSLQRLEHLSSDSAKNERTKKISAKTREMLIKSRATGNDNCQVEDRFYFMIHFEPLVLSPSSEESDSKVNDLVGSIKASTNSIQYRYFSRYSSLGEMLFQLKQSQADLLVYIASKLDPSLTRIEDIGISLQTTDTPDWKVFNALKTARLEEIFLSFEEVWIKIVPLSQLLTLQLNPILNMQFHPATSAVAAGKSTRQASDVKSSSSSSPLKASTQTTATATAAGSTSSELKKEFKKGDRVWYYKDSNNSVFSSFLEAYDHRDEIHLQLAEILAIHHDDFPNIYYTINLLPATAITASAAASGSTATTSLSGEKQTDNRHLLAYHPSEERILLDQQLQSYLQHYQTLGTAVVRLHICYKNQEIAILPVGNGVTIGQLRQLISSYLLPPVNDKAKMRLICKGFILKDDHQTLAKNSKIVDGAKIMVMASE